MYKSKKGWYYKHATAIHGVGPFETAEKAKKAANRDNPFCYLGLDRFVVYYGTPRRLSAAKDVYVKDRGHVYFTRIR